MLDFIQRHRRGQAGNEPIRILLRRRQNAGVVKGQILATLLFEFRQLGQSALAGLPRAVDQNGGRVRQRLEELLGEVTTNHGCIINHSSDDNQPLFGRIAPLVVKKSASTDRFNRAKTDRKRYGRITSSTVSASQMPCQRPPLSS